MAESVDATVSNTVGATHPGSSPGPGTAEEKDASFSPPFLWAYKPKSGGMRDELE